MFVSPYVFKSKAARALKGNWQTALLVSFFASLPFTVVQLLQATQLPDLTQSVGYEAMRAAVAAIPQSTWLLMGLAAGLSLVLSPVLAVGCNHYFISRLRGNELGFGGLFSRLRSAGKALGLFLLIYVKTFLWSLLLVVPGIIAAIRYSMAPFYLAETPEMSVWEALRKSKETMRDQKMTLFMLELSFLGWLLGAMLSEMLLSGISVILALVTSQFIQLFMATYLNAACASFFLAASVPGGIRKAQSDAAAWLKNAGLGGDLPGWNRTGFGNDDNRADTEEDEPAPDEGEDETLGDEPKPQDGSDPADTEHGPNDSTEGKQEP
ncbi:MAG TPA: DUF975 family protein [Candidatus Limiplasma sp.]|nr:DUF975 family protein [Candidatus Limiplasma sp.]HPS80829.1 DUF975 family protein [Candidatus Limiplasma sp.]